MSTGSLPEPSPELYDQLKNRLQTHDKEGAIELYYQLLSAGRSVGEIISSVGPLSDTGEKITAVEDHTSLAAAVPGTSAGEVSATAAEASSSLRTTPPVAASIALLSQNSTERQQPDATVTVEA